MPEADDLTEILLPQNYAVAAFLGAVFDCREYIFVISKQSIFLLSHHFVISSSYIVLPRNTDITM
jgi:hypothetical protein